MVRKIRENYGLANLNCLTEVKQENEGRGSEGEKAERTSRPPSFSRLTSVQLSRSHISYSVRTSNESHTQNNSLLRRPPRVRVSRYKEATCKKAYKVLQRVGFWGLFGLKTGIDFAHFGLVFEGTMGAYEHSYCFNYKQEPMGSCYK